MNMRRCLAAAFISAVVATRLRKLRLLSHRLALANPMAMFERDAALHVRLFNASGDDTPGDLAVGVEAGKLELVELDGRVIEELKAVVDDKGRRTIHLNIPRFGFRTLRFREINTLRPE